MTIKLNGRKSVLYASAMAISLVGISGAAFAQAGALNGSYATGSDWANTGEADSEVVIKDTRTPEQKAKDAADYAVRAAAVNQISIAQATSDAAAAYKLALKNEAAAPAAAAKAAAKVLSTEAAKIAADGQAALILAQKSSAVGSLAAAEGNQAAAESAFDDAVAADTAASTSTTQAAVAAAALAKAKADAAVALAAERVDVLTAAYAQAASEATSALTAYTTAITDKAAKDAAVQTTIAARITSASALTVAIANDEDFQSSLAVVNAAAGTNFTATYEGLGAIAAYAGVDPSEPVYASNGYTREAGILKAAAASANQSISLASGALTDSAAALAVGANFETEVLGALVDHETRIVANTTAIATEVTERKAAVAALDVRTTANTTAIANEVTARVAADNALGARITTETNERIAADNVLRDQIASSTATAIAMGGAALLPDMGFTLSGNIAVYEGAQAMALNAAAKVGANAYVTAAVGGGLNKNGSVGGRVGFVFGF